MTLNQNNAYSPASKGQKIKAHAKKHGKKYGQGIIIIFFILGLFLCVHLKMIYDRAQNIRLQAAQIPALLTERDFSKAQEALGELTKELESTQGLFSRLKIFHKVPWAGKQIKGAKNLVEAGALASEATRDSAEILAAIPFSEADDISLQDIDYSSREFILAKIFSSSEKLPSVLANIQEARSRLNKISDPGILSIITANAKLLDEKLALAEKVLVNAEPLLKVIPELAGFAEEKNYLFLLLNNDELRPAGGFISAYSLLNIKNSFIAGLELDDTYNLDKKFIGRLGNQAPAPLAKYNYSHPWYPNTTGEWFFRDATWSPDFKEAALLAQEFYLKESDNDTPIDGVIAVTPTFISELLALSGNLEVREYFIGKNNLADILEYESHTGHRQVGLPMAERKKLIFSSLVQMFNNIFDLENADWPALLNIFFDNLNKKQVVIYSHNPEIQNELVELNWAGQIKDTAGDYLLVTDANLASLKTNRVVNREINYKIVPDENTGYKAQVEITYKHTGEPSYKTTRYGAYTTIYTPIGSQLIEVIGNEDEVDKGQNFNKQWFATYINVDFGQEKTLTFNYQLPAQITSQIKKGEYNLLVQKQAGSVNDQLKLNLDFKKQIISSQPKKPDKQTEDNLYHQDLKFNTDQEFQLKLKKNPFVAIK